MIVIGSKDLDSRRKLVRQWPARVKALQRQFVYTVANDVYEELSNRLPTQVENLRKSLRLSKIVGLPDSAIGYAVRSVVRGKVVEAAEADKTVLYVSARRGRMQAKPDWLKVLESFNPWTVDTLPMRPDPKEAHVVSRVVSPRVVEHVRFLRRQDRTRWRRRLAEVGVKISTSSEMKAGRKVRAVPDVAFESMRLEFGVGSTAAHPHWRPAVSKFALRGGVRQLAKTSAFKKTMFDMRFNGWRNWPTPVADRISVARAKKYVPFQEKLGIRVAG